MVRFDCSICTNSCTESSKVTCSACNFDTCRTCFQTWITSSMKDPECMSCHLPFNWDALNNATTKSFMNNEYKKHRRSVLLDREKALIPSTMHLVERERQLRECDKMIKDVHARKGELMEWYYSKIRELNQQEADIRNQMRIISNGQATIKGIKFLQKCPVDHCKGYLDDKHFCSLCENKICMKCMEIKEEGHECDQNKVETVKLIKAESKPCPNCGARIQKSHGCSQMWCVECKVFFNWNNGEIITGGALHNPEYLEWMRRTGGQLHREIGDQYCGGMPNILVKQETIILINTKYGEDVRMYVKTIQELCRRVNHIADWDMRRFPITPLDQINQNIRLRYLLDEITEEKFSRELQLSEKKNNYNNEIRCILTLITEVVSDKLRELLSVQELENHRGHVWKNAEQTVNMIKIFKKKIEPELKTFRDYVNTSFDRIARRYTRKVLICTENFNITTAAEQQYLERQRINRG